MIDTADKIQTERLGHNLVLLCIFEDKILLINHHGSKLAEYPADQITFWVTKNKNPRTVPLVGVAREIVARRCRGLKADDQLFTYS